MAEEKLVLDLEALDTEAKQPKVMFAGDSYDGQPYLLVSEEDIVLAGSKKSVVSVSPDFGILLGGPVSLSCLPDELSFGGGYWRLDPRHLATLASTTPTPIPLLVKSTPQLLRAQDDLQGAVDGIEAFSGLV